MLDKSTSKHFLMVIRCFDFVIWGEPSRMGSLWSHRVKFLQRIDVIALFVEVILEKHDCPSAERRSQVYRLTCFTWNALPQSRAPTSFQFGRKSLRGMLGNVVHFSSDSHMTRRAHSRASLAWPWVPAISNLAKLLRSMELPTVCQALPGIRK